jgi:hypothetical protein
LIKNGLRASNRYVLCACSHHDGDPGLFDVLASELSGWTGGVPEDKSLASMLAYVDQANAAIRPLTAEGTE